MADRLITDLDTVRRMAASRWEEFDSLREAIEFDGTLSDTALDAMIDSLYERVAAQIDCTQCANCCRTLDVCLVPDDIPRLSAALHISPDEIVTRYADQERGAEQDEWAIIPVHPCPLLAGNLCSIYEHRPHACRVYPQLTPEFRYNMEDAVEGAVSCPIIYNVLSALADRIEPLPHDEQDAAEHDDWADEDWVDEEDAE